MKQFYRIVIASLCGGIWYWLLSIYMIHTYNTVIVDMTSDVKSPVVLYTGAQNKTSFTEKSNSKPVPIKIGRHIHKIFINNKSIAKIHFDRGKENGTFFFFTIFIYFSPLICEL